MRDRYSSFFVLSFYFTLFEAYNFQLKNQMRLEIGHVFFLLFSIDDDDDDGVYVVRKTNIHTASNDIERRCEKKKFDENETRTRFIVGPNVIETYI